MKSDAIFYKIEYGNVIIHNLFYRLILFMRRLRSYVFVLLILICFLILLPYFLVQTSFGIKIVSQQLSKITPYTISIGSVHHSLSKFYEVTLDDVVVQDKQQEVLNIHKLIIELDKDNLWQLTHFDYITVFDGLINDTEISQSAISANTLRLIDSTVNVSFGENQVSVRGVVGGIKPFILSGETYQFDLTAKELLFNQLPMESVLIQGFQRDGMLSITNLGGNISNGFFVGKLALLADGSLDIDQLKINNINFQSNVDHQDLNVFFSDFPRLTIHHLSLFDSSIQLPDFSIEKGNIEATNLSYDQDWHFNQSSLVFNADALVWHDSLFSSPLIQLQSDSHGITIEKAIATWNNGNVNFAGHWQDDQLQLNQLTMAGVNYQLPQQASEFVLPAQLNQVTIDRLMILPSTLIASNPDYPFVFNNFEISGSNVTVVQHQKVGLYAGTLFFKSESGALNGVSLRYPDLVVKFDTDNRSIFNFSALLDGGMIEASALVNPEQTEFLSLKMSAYNVTSALLEKWKLIKDPPSVVSFSADLQGEIASFALSGTLSSSDNNYSITPQH